MQLLVKTSGSKLWEFVYKSPKILKRRKTSLGNYPQVSLLNARNKKMEYHKLIANNIDPIDYFKEIKNKIKEKNKIYTIEKVSNDYFELKEVAEYLSIGLSTVWLYKSQDKLTSKKINKRVTVFSYR